jgi:putative oxidoreductase
MMDSGYDATVHKVLGFLLRKSGDPAESEDVARAAAVVHPKTDNGGRVKLEASAPFAAAGLALGRLLLAAVFILEGWGKLRGYQAAAAYMDRYGVPSLLLPAVIALELGGGALIAAGFHTRVAALALAAFSTLAAILFHGDFSERSHVLHFEKDLAIAGGLLVLAVAGAGSWSLERTLAGKVSRGR